MFHPQKTVAAAAAEAKRAVRRLARPAGEFDASRYFRGAHDLGFHNTGAGPLRALARAIHAAQADRWGVNDAMAFADALMPDRYLEVKAIGVKGAGEIGITGVAASIANAVYHATGKRIRDLPIRVDRVMA